VELTVERLAAADCVVIATHHAAVDLELVVQHARRIVDLRNAVRQNLAGGPSGPIPANVDVL
jgi:UDP-N-acetyl-D-glucosamine dehydrogenase